MIERVRFYGPGYIRPADDIAEECGQKAYIKGYGVDTNPFRSHTGLATQWHKGWIAQEALHIENAREFTDRTAGGVS
jgi:hypothetical protein